MSANGEKTTRRERVERGTYRNPKTVLTKSPSPTATGSGGGRRLTAT